MVWPSGMAPVWWEGSQHDAIVTDYPTMFQSSSERFGCVGGLDRRIGDVPPDAGSIDLPRCRHIK